MTGVQTCALPIYGVFAPGHSTGVERAGLVVANLSGSIGRHADIVRTHLASVVDSRVDAFSAINAAYLQDGALVVARPNTALRTPIHLLHVSTQGEAAVHPRVLIVAETGAELTVIEDYVSLHDGVYAVNGVTEVKVAQNASVRHVKLQRESRGAFHIATCAVSLERDARFTSTVITLGARISRFNLNLQQRAAGARMEADGLALIGDGQLADTHSFFDHAAPDGSSRQSHKTVLNGDRKSVV